MRSAGVVLPGQTPVAEAEAESAPDVAYRKYRRLVPWAVGLSVATLVGLSVHYQFEHGGDVLAELRRRWPRPSACTC